MKTVVKELSYEKVLNIKNDAAKRSDANQSIANMAKLLEANSRSLGKEALDSICTQLGKTGKEFDDYISAHGKSTKTVTEYLKNLSTNNDPSNMEAKIVALDLSKTADDLITGVERARRSDELLAAGGIKNTGKSNDKDGK